MDRRIAVVGIGARLPGGRGPTGVWNMLARQTSEIGSAPASRLPFLTEHDITDPDFVRICRTGGYVEGWDEFDHSVFGISAREAEVMDPQQRIALETAFEAINDAGLTLDYLQQRSTGVISGYITRDNWANARRAARMDAMSNVGHTGSGLSSRISHVFGLTGPSTTVDTACSTGLTAVATAIENILLGSCSIAIAAANNIILDPYETLSFHRSHLMAPDSHCKFGTTVADGFVRSDGFVAVVLRPLADAIAENDRIYAVVEAVVTGNDGGRSGSFPTPSVEGQAEVIRRALELAGRTPQDVDYVEAHGTGTTVGDRVELDGLSSVFGERGLPLPVGSVKTRIGHCEATSGLAGFAVAALSLHHGAVRPMLVHGELREELVTAEHGLRAQVTTSLPLPEDAVIGVNSFGITGTNSHAILAAPPRARDTENTDLPSLPRLTSAGVDAPAPAAVLAYRVNHTTEGRQVEGDAAHPAPGHLAGLWREAPKVVFAFGGFGARWLDPTSVTDPLLRAHLDATYAAIRARLRADERDLFDGGAATPAALQPYATWASQLAIAFTLRDYGVVPDAVLGHSFGDIAAACVAGAFDVESAADLLVARTEAVREHSDRTRMIVITGEAVAANRDWIPDWADVAVVNSPTCLVLACPEDGIDTIAELASAQGHDPRPLDVVFGSHSRFVEPAIPAFTPAASAADENRGTTAAFYSANGTAEGARRTVPEGHWLTNLRSPVDLPPVVGRLAEDGYQVIVDIGPKSVLAGHLRAQFAGTVIETDAGENAAFLHDTLGALFTAGVPLRPARLPKWSSKLADKLAWQLTPRRLRPIRPVGRNLVMPAPSASLRAETATFELRGEQLRGLSGHQVRGETVVPGTLTLGCIVRAVASGGVPLSVPLHVDSVRFVEAVVIDEHTDYLAFTVTRTGNQVDVAFRTDPAAEPTPCCTATLARADAAVAPSIELPLNLTPLSVERFYRECADAGNLWDGPFRAMTELWASTTHAHVTAELREPLSAAGEIDPALFDAALHGLAAVHFGFVAGGRANSPFYFDGLDRITFHRPELHGRTRSIIAPSRSGRGFDIAILDEQDRVAIQCTGVRVRPLDHRSIQALHRTWAPFADAATIDRADYRLLDLAQAPLGPIVVATADPNIAEPDLESVAAKLLARVGADHELLVDARALTDCPTASMTDYLAGLGQALTRLASAAAEAGTPLGIVVADIENLTAGEFAAATTGFLFTLAGALAAEFPSLAVAVVSTDADPLGEVPSIRALSERGEHRVRRAADGTLWVARLTEAPARPTQSPISEWSADIRLDPARACELELVWSDPNRGARDVGVRPLPDGYRQLRGLPDVLWAAHAAPQLVALARLGGDDLFAVRGESHRAALLKLALDTATSATYPGPARLVDIALDESVAVHIGSAGDTGGAILTMPELDPSGTWPRSLAYRRALTSTESALLELTDPASPEPAGESAQPRRAALIVGGNGGLGTALAADLLARSFDEVIIVGTREVEVQAPLDYLRLDVTESSSVDALEQRLRKADADELFIFHLAGRISSGPLTELERGDWLRVLGPKVEGTRNLVDLATRTGARLVAYSSASAVLPSPQFAHYGAANGALEGILAAAANRVRVHGIRWGFWAGAGMLRDLDPNRSFTPSGVRELSAEQGNAFLWHTLDEPGTDFPVCYPADWAQFGNRYETIRRDALLSTLRGSTHTQPAAPVNAPTLSTPAEHVTPLESLIMDTLKIADVSVVRAANHLRTIGLDSLLAVELRTKIKSAFGQTVPIRTLLGSITPAGLGDLVTGAEPSTAGGTR